MAISLNDHENRIKNFEAKLPDISNRITNLENNPKSSVTRIDAATLGQMTFSSNPSSINISSKISGLTSTSYVSYSNIRVDLHANFWYGYKSGLPDLGLTRSGSKSFTYGDLTSNTPTSFGINVNNGSFSLSVGNANFGRPIYCRMTGAIYVVNANNLYYKLLDRVSSLYKEVVSWLLV